MPIKLNSKRKQIIYPTAFLERREENEKRIAFIAASMIVIMLCLATAISVVASDGDTEIFDDEISFNDVSETSEYYEAIINAANAKIMSGYENGNFEPNGNISRTEFAAIICRLLGVDSEAKNLSTSTFDDVSSTHWAVGSITKAVNLGIINGYDNKTFGPSNNVTYEQAIKMLVCAECDYDNVEALGGYPDGYISLAKSNGILDGISYRQKNDATRGNIAKMINNILQNRENAFIYIEDDNLTTIID